MSCPNCGAENVVLLRVESGLKLRLQEEGSISSVPNEACEACHLEFSKMISRSAMVRAESAAKEDNRLQLWRSRVNLVKQGKLLMQTRKFAEAAAAYEKYLRVLEIVYDRKTNDLSPQLFSNQARKQEIMVISSVYWDLMRIYDTSARYGDRQRRAAEKLAEFARFTPVFANIARKAESQVRNAKNKDAYKYFLKLINASRPRCFIATSAFDGRSPEVIQLCHFRDGFLSHRPWGRSFIFQYYRHSPRLAEFLDAHPSMKPPVRKVLRAVANCVAKFPLNDPRAS